MNNDLINIQYISNYVSYATTYLCVAMLLLILSHNIEISVHTSKNQVIRYIYNARDYVVFASDYF